MGCLLLANTTGWILMLLASAGVHSAFTNPRKLLQTASPRPYVQTPDLLYLSLLARANYSTEKEDINSPDFTLQHVAEDYSLVLSYTLYCSSPLQQSKDTSLVKRAALLQDAAKANTALAANKTLQQTFNASVQATLAALQWEAQTPVFRAAAPPKAPDLGLDLSLPGFGADSSDDTPATILQGFTIPLPGDLGEVKIPSVNLSDPLAEVELPQINLTGLGLDVELPTITRRPRGAWDKNECMWFDAFGVAHARYLLAAEGLMAAYLLNITQGSAAQAAAARQGATRLLVEALACDWEDAFWSARKSFIDLYLPHLSHTTDLTPDEWTPASVADIEEYTSVFAAAVAEAAGPQVAKAIKNESAQLFKQAQAEIAAMPLTTRQCKASINQTVKLITSEVSYNGTVGLLKLPWPGMPARDEPQDTQALESVFYKQSPVAVKRPTR